MHDKSLAKTLLKLKIITLLKLIVINFMKLMIINWLKLMITCFLIVMILNLMKQMLNNSAGTDDNKINLLKLTIINMLK